jgi:hypothetical protein
MTAVASARAARARSSSTVRRLPRDGSSARSAVCTRPTGADVSIDEGTPVTEAYRTPFKFTGKIASVTIELKDVKAAEHDEAVHARKVAGVKKALAD